jgi:hypothetical protein
MVWLKPEAGLRDGAGVVAGEPERTAVASAEPAGPYATAKLLHLSMPKANKFLSNYLTY